MSNKKQSSVEWLIKELNDNIDFIPMSKWDEIRDIVQKAKAMHKEEMKEMYLKGIENYDTTFKRKDNETFGEQDE